MSDLRVRADPPADDIDRALADCVLDESYPWNDAMQLVLYEGAEPIGVMTGRHEAWPDGGKFLHLTTFVLRPAWRGQGLWPAFAPALFEHCRAHGLRALTCAFKKDDPPEVIATARKWGFQDYGTDAHGLTWWVWYLPQMAEEVSA